MTQPDEWRIEIAGRISSVEEKLDAVHHEVFNHGEGLAAKVDRVTGRLDTLMAVLRDREERDETMRRRIMAWVKIGIAAGTLILSAHGIIDFIAKVEHGQLYMPHFSRAVPAQPAYAVDKPQDARIPVLVEGK